MDEDILGKVYVPAVIDYEEGGYSEFVLKDTATVTVPGPDDSYEILKDFGGNVIGFRWRTGKSPR